MRFIILRFRAEPTSSGCVLLHSVEFSMFVPCQSITCSHSDSHCHWYPVGLHCFWQGCARRGQQLCCCCRFAQFREWWSVQQRNLQSCNSSNLSYGPYSLCFGLQQQFAKGCGMTCDSLTDSSLLTWQIIDLNWLIIIDLFSHILRFVAHQLCDMTWQWHRDTAAFDQVAPDMDTNCDAAADSSSSESEDPFSIICKAATGATWPPWPFIQSSQSSTAICEQKDGPWRTHAEIRDWDRDLYCILYILYNIYCSLHCTLYTVCCLLLYTLVTLDSRLQTL